MTAFAPRVLLMSLAAAAAGCAQLATAPAPKAGAAPTATAGAGGGAAAPTPVTTPPGQVGAANRPAGATPTPAPGATPVAATPPLPAFPVVIKDARRIDGPITAWQKDEKLWFELRPDQLGKPFLFTPKIRTGIGEGLLVGGLMTYPVAGAGGAQVVEFVRVHNSIRLQARNVEISAKAGTPEALAVASTYANSLLGVANVASQPHPDRKSVLIDAGAMFLNDIAGLGLQLQRQFRQGYSQDTRNSLVTGVRGTDTALIIETQTHWWSGAPSTGVPLNPLAALAGVAPSLPRYVPDTRSLVIGQHLSLQPLPDTPMPTRRADPRVGFFATRVLDFSDDLARTPVQRHIMRWRLEKKDPAAEVSEPVKPITFWIDRNVPLAYRETVRSAILEWNKAFDRIGFRNAIVVEQQADDAKYDTLDPGYPSVRWLMSAEPAITAIGQTQMDPRTGEILDADIAFEGLFARAQRYARTQLMAARAAGAAAAAGGQVAPPDGEAAAATTAFGAPAFATPAFATPAFAPPPFAAPPLAMAPGAAAPGRAGQPGHEWCLHGDALAEQTLYALDLMAVQADLPPDSPLAQQFVLDYLKDTVMHEVGHALGLRHNFRASRIYTEAQLADAEFTRAYGTTGSVMEYNAVNLARPGRSGGVPFQTTLGPYDYWAIEYGYKPLPAGSTPAAEAALLQAVAARSAAPELAFGTDEDVAFGLDAETIQFDLGADPLAFASKRLDIARDLFRRQEGRDLPPEQDYSVLRRSLQFALNDGTRALAVLARQLGGLRTLRDHPGSGRDPLQPVATAVQRQAFELMLDAVFSDKAFRVTPALQRRLAPDYLDRGEFAGLPTDYNVPQRLLDLQRAVLAYLLSDQLATRLADAGDKLDAGQPPFAVAEVYRRLGQELWAELDNGRSVPQARRDLQRDHLNRLAFAVLRPSPAARADARSAQRREAQALLTRLEAAAARRGAGADDATRHHLADCLDTLRRALRAELPRAGL